MMARVKNSASGSDSQMPMAPIKLGNKNSRGMTSKSPRRQAVRAAAWGRPVAVKRTARIKLQPLNNRAGAEKRSARAPIVSSSLLSPANSETIFSAVAETKAASRMPATITALLATTNSSQIGAVRPAPKL